MAVTENLGSSAFIFCEATPNEQSICWRVDNTSLGPHKQGCVEAARLAMLEEKTPPTADLAVGLAQH